MASRSPNDQQPIPEPWLESHLALTSPYQSPVQVAAAPRCPRCGAPVRSLLYIQQQLAGAEQEAERLAANDLPREPDTKPYRLGVMEAIASLAARALACHTQTCRAPGAR